MIDSRRRRRRRSAGIATIVGGAIAAVLLNWMGFGAKPKPAPPAAEQSEAAQRSASKQSDQTTGGAFDFYNLALSLAPAFCETEPQKKQCRKLSAQSNHQTPLTLHGLWPEYGRAGSYPENCPGDSVTVKTLENSIDPNRLRTLMPGVVDGLVGHEWRKHGTCSGLSPTRYFVAAIDWTERVNGALASVLQAASGKQMSTVGVRNAAEKIMPGLGTAMTLHCRNIKTSDASVRGKPVLLELRVCLSKNDQGEPVQLTECAAFDRIDQGCGASFVVDGL